MSVSRFCVIDDTTGTLKEYLVEGSTFSPYGAAKSVDGSNAPSTSRSEAIRRTAEISAICNDSKIVYLDDKKAFSNVGEPTEAALKVLAEKLGCDNSKVMASLTSLSPKERASAVNEYYGSSIPRLLTFEFSRDRKMMSVLVCRGSDSTKGALFVKGAPESVINRCTLVRVGGQTVPLSSQLRANILEQTANYGSKGLRTLALAYTDTSDTNIEHYMSNSTADYARFEQNLTFVSLVGMLDPPRPEVKIAIANCKAAGIRVICITGDNKGTAETICRQIGIFGEDEDLTGKSYTGREWDALSKAEKLETVARANLFSRTEPGHKSELVDLLQSMGLVVAMTGGTPFVLSLWKCSKIYVFLDGVNDAPALRKADIGVAMGSGTDVAKLAADMVLADSNFATIERAVEEGRLIYNNTKQFIRYLSKLPSLSSRSTFLS
jgi:Ca2+ transporting ATPase